MSKGINKVILIGNLGSDPEIRYMASGTPAVTLSVATSESWKDKQTGEKKEITEWHRIVFFDKLADICRDYIKKGSKIYVEGKLQTKKWTDKHGIERYTTQILGNEMQMLDRKQEGGDANVETYENGISQDAKTSANDYAKASGKAAPGFEPPQYDDDIPF